MMKYRAKPVVIEAVKLERDRESIEQVVRFIADEEASEEWVTDNIEAIFHYGLHIQTLEGVMRADFGDYVIKGTEGEFYPCKPNIFEGKYEVAEE